MTRKQIKRLCRINSQISRFRRPYTWVTHSVSPTSRLMADYVLSTAAELEVDYGFNVEEEITRVLSAEILAELYNGDKDQYVKEFPIVANYLPGE